MLLFGFVLGFICGALICWYALQSFRAMSKTPHE
jgi:hypothetical protein